MLSVRDLMLLNCFRSFRLVAGEKGLDRKVQKVNILDFEFREYELSETEPEGVFEKNALVLATFLYAKEEPELILPGLKQLIADGISALAVKDIYFSELPPEVLEYADRVELPVFFYRDTEMEDIIVDVLTEVRRQDRVNDLEAETGRLMDENLPAEIKHALVLKLVPFYHSTYICSCYLPKKERQISVISYQRTMLDIKKYSSEKVVFLPWRGGILEIRQGESPSMEFEFFFRKTQFYCGEGKPHKGIVMMPYALQEAVYAAEEAKKRKEEETVRFSDLGLDQILLPTRQNHWIRQFCDEAKAKIQKSGEDQELLQTLQAYVKNDYDVVKTADQLCLHKNSVRYRLAKGKEILDMEDNEQEFRIALYFLFH